MMKTIKFAIYNVTFITLFFIFSTQLTAQNSWVGGTPGTPTAWENPRNWSENHVPDEFDLTVIIPNVSTTSGYFPIIKTEVPTISFLNVEGGAKLTIEADGYLMIDGASTYNYGIQNTGAVFIYGHLAIQNTSLEAFANPKHNIHDYSGVAYQDSKPLGVIAKNK